MSVVTPAEAAARFAALQLKVAAPFTPETAPVFEAGKDVLVAALQAAAPKRTGQYAAGITATTILNPRTASISAWGAKPLTQWLIDGTQPHVIVPVRAKALFWPGALHPVMRVNHPGTAPNPWHVAPANAAAETIGQAMAEAVVRSMANAI